jgi:hypothetical protein
MSQEGQFPGVPRDRSGSEGPIWGQSGGAVNIEVNLAGGHALMTGTPLPAH